MKILHVLSSPHLGGAEVMCLQLARHQQESGHLVQVHLLAGGDTLREAERLGVEVRHHELDNSTLTKTQLRAHHRADLAASVRELAPDIVHSHVPKTNLLCHTTLHDQPTPWITTIHGSWRQFAYSPEAARRPILKPWLLLRHAAGDYLTTRSARKIAAISEYVKQQLCQIGVSADRITVVNDGLEFAPEPIEKTLARREFGLPENAFVIGSLGHFAPVKGFDLLIAAFAKLAERHLDLRLLIAGGDVLGDPTVRNQLRGLAERIGVADRVHLAGAVSTRQPFLSALDLFAVTSRTEGFSLSLVEAMQHGLPCVVTSKGGCVEAARPEMESAVFRSGNIEDLASVLRRLIEDKELRTRLGSAARERAESCLTLAKCGQKYEQLYEEATRSSITNP